MLGSRSTIIIFIAVWTCVAGQCDDKSPTSDKKDFPDIFNIAVGESYQIHVELNYKNIKQTTYFTEYYDVVNKRGRVDKEYNGEIESFIYSYESKEAFVIKEGECNAQKLTDIPPFETDLTWNWEDYESKLTILGPSAILRQAYLNNDKVVYMGNSETVRGMKALKWRQCFLDKELTVDYYFSDPSSWKEPYGVLQSIPLRINVSGKAPEIQDALPQTYEFVPFQPYISDLNVLEIPYGMGCKLQNSTQKPPTFKGKDIDVYGELVFTSPDDEWKYISNFRITYDSRSGNLIYQYTPWLDGNEDNGEAKIGDVTYEIYDLHHNVSYKYKGLEHCKAERFKEASPKIVLPGYNGRDINILEPKYFISKNKYRYMGTNTVRGYEVDVYERVVSYRGSVDAILTRFYLRDDTYRSGGGIENNAPIKMQIVYKDWDWSEGKEMTKGNATFNFYGFTTYIPYKHQRFAIAAPCFPENGIRFVITYSVDAEDVKRAKKVVPEIIEEATGNLYLYGVGPTRLHDVLVDFDNTHIYVSAVLVDRVHWNIDFDELPGESLSSYSERQLLQGIKTEDDCAKSCLEKFDTCEGYSFCSKKRVCYVTSNEYDYTTYYDDCTTRFRNSNLPPIPSLDNLRRKIMTLWKEKKLNLALKNPEKEGEQPRFVSATSVTFLDENLGIPLTL